MEGHIFRAFCLTLLVGSVLQCFASESSESTNTGPDFIAVIPKDGLEEENVERVFSLGPSDTLQVIDETANAVYLPSASESTGEILSGDYTVAYRFANGSCDFSQTIVFRDAFLGYPTPLWVREESKPAKSGNVSPGGAVKYTFTHPPAEYLGGGLSFCVQFKTVLATGSGSQSTVSTKPPPATSESTTPHKPPKPEEQNNQQQTEDSDQKDPAAGGESGTDDQAQEEEEEGEGGNSESDGSHDGASGSDSQSNTQIQQQQQAGQGTQNQNQESAGGQSTTTEQPGAAQYLHHDQEFVNGETGDYTSIQLRRLSGTPDKEAYLTIVVHSAAWGSASGMTALSVSLLAVAAASLLIY
ncbi:Toxoplasma gondii family A protein [Toxoplasma gondii GAB2-2007-GAL-DOM2]|uniref:Toxoplasma gondii family A protein n=5 Tax=Toxoplasma gondii TaxID=5811 RepID=S7UZN3_TOXGG|nr:Toxoplasma gondii family A protein [Toxoplasma gondii GT1]KAF4638932.1 Toxoplasma gondii family A protein [Toxoplasma gondii]KFG34566.1 Toxoplasma gondii family A protein [Toxoplasma gondii GAB2-2007-GAL-DOM2]KFG46084.1 Toxoplasma gondii family A protein [Toxoplasma gondii FOU]RQX70369.1 Toxoplasma gondii family A protein [Toxoplasma gondii CAST]